MNPNESVQWQAWVDGETDPATERKLAAQSTRDPEAQSLCENLRAVRQLLRENEPAHAVEESREFYWSAIRRGIEAESRRSTQAATRPVRRVFPWFAWLLPAGALAILMLWMFFPTRPAGTSTPLAQTQPLPANAASAMVGHEVHTPDTGMTTLTFYSAQDSLTVVWLGKVELL